MNDRYVLDAEFRAFSKPVLDLMAGELDGEGYKRVLEIGTGYGAVARRIATNGRVVYAIDLYDEKVVEARKSTGDMDDPLIKWVIMDCESMGFKDNVFDAIVSMSVLQYTHVEKVYPELKRVLCKGGKVILMENMRYNPFSWCFRVVRFLKGGVRLPGMKIVRRLNFKDIEFLRTKFEWVSHKEFYFLSILALFWLLGIRSITLFRRSYDLLSRADTWLLGKAPILNRMCWITFIVCKHST